MTYYKKYDIIIMGENNNKDRSAPMREAAFTYIALAYARARSSGRPGPVFGKIWCIWRVARSREKIAYGVYRAGIRASTVVPGPLSFGNANGCSGRPHFAKKMLKSLAKSKNVPGTLVCGTPKKTRFNPRLFLVNRTLHFRNSYSKPHRRL